MSNYIKLLNENLIHYGFRYKDGLNVDHQKFNSTGSCLPGGLYYTNFKNLFTYLQYGTKIADVEIPPDARVYAEPCGTKWKADKLIIRNIRPIEDLPEWNDEKFCLLAAKNNGFTLQYIKKQTVKICLAAVKQNGIMLQFVKEQTPEICLAAVNQCGLALYYVKDKTSDICVSAVKNCHFAIKYAPDNLLAWMEVIKIEPNMLHECYCQTVEICLSAVKQNGWTLYYVKEQTPEICLAAVNQCGSTLKHVKEQTPEICLAAVKQYGLALAYVRKQNVDICLAAVKQNPKAIDYVSQEFIAVFADV